MFVNSKYLKDFSCHFCERFIFRSTCQISFINSCKVYKYIKRCFETTAPIYRKSSQKDQNNSFYKNNLIKT